MTKINEDVYYNVMDELGKSDKEKTPMTATEYRHKKEDLDKKMNYEFNRFKYFAIISLVGILLSRDLNISLILLILFLFSLRYHIRKKKQYMKEYDELLKEFCNSTLSKVKDAVSKSMMNDETCQE